MICYAKNIIGIAKQLKTVITLSVLALMIISRPAEAETDPFKPSISFDQQVLYMCSRADMTVMHWFNLGQVALYLQDCHDSNKQWRQQPIQLSFVYNREFSADDFIESSQKLLKRNMSEQQFTAIEPSLKQFVKNFKPVKEGDRYDIRYAKETGLVLLKNGTVVSRSDSSELGQEYYLIWFGKKPFSTSIKLTLLAPIRLDN